MIPSSGQMNVSNAAPTRSGLASQIMSNPSRGKSPANMANRQPNSLTSCRVPQYPPLGRYLTLAYDRDTTVTTLLSQANFSEVHRRRSQRSIRRRMRGFLINAKSSLAASRRALRSKSATTNSAMRGFLLSVLRRISPLSTLSNRGTRYLGIIHPPFGGVPSLVDPQTNSPTVAHISTLSSFSKATARFISREAAFSIAFSRSGYISEHRSVRSLALLLSLLTTMTHHFRRRHLAQFLCAAAIFERSA